jgi:hypothetical protein
MALVPAARAASRKYLHKITLTYGLHRASSAKAFVLVHPLHLDLFRCRAHKNWAVTLVMIDKKHRVMPN